VRGVGDQARHEVLRRQVASILGKGVEEAGEVRGVHEHALQEPGRVVPLRAQARVQVNAPTLIWSTGSGVTGGIVQVGPGYRALTHTAHTQVFRVVQRQAHRLWMARV